MALTPEDVVNKRFQPTKFREGYDQDEVDDFLDEVVVELRRLNQETEELRQRLIASDSRINELQRSAAQPAPAAFDQPVAASAPAPAAAPAAFAGSAVEPSIDPSNTNNLLQLARRLHEEHVREGVEKRDALIAEGHATAARVTDEAQANAARVTDEAEANASRVVDESQTEAARLLEEGQATAARALEEGQANAARALEEAATQTRNQISSLDQERTALEGRVEELRNFEREYRSKLKGYIEGQLRELDTTSAVTVDSAPEAVPAGVPAGQGFDAPAYDGQGFDGANYSGQIAPPAAASYPGFAGN
jgi:DivIVA domain-containing protein